MIACLFVARPPDSPSGLAPAHLQVPDRAAALAATHAANQRATVLLLAAASFFSGMTLRLPDGLLPRLARDFDITAGTAGQVVLAFSFAYCLMQLVFGPLGDRFGKDRMVTVALGGCALMAAVAAVMPDFDTLLVARVGWGMAAAGIIPLAMAWIGDAVPYDERQATLARLLLGTLTGMSAGQLAGGFFGDSVVGWRGAFFTMAVGFSIITALLVWRLRAMSLAAAAVAGPGARAQGQTQTAAPAPGADEGAWRRSGRQILSVLQTPWNRRVLLAVFVEGVFLLAPLAFVPTMLHHRFDLSLSAASGLVAFYAVGGLAYALLARRLVSALGERRMVVIGGGLMGLGAAAWWLSPWAWTAGPVALLVGFGTYLFHNTLQTLATQMAPYARGTAVSLFAFLFFLGQAVGVTVFGWALDRYGASGLLLPSVLALPLAGWVFARALARRAATHSDTASSAA